MSIQAITFRTSIVTLGIVFGGLPSATCVAQQNFGGGIPGLVGGLGGNAFGGGQAGGGQAGASTGAGLGTAGANGQQAISQGNAFRGFTANLGGTSVPFSTTQALSGTNKIGSLAGANSAVPAGGIGGLSGGGLGGINGLGGGLGGGFGGGLGGGFGGNQNRRNQFGGGATNQTQNKRSVKATIKPALEPPKPATIAARSNQIQSRLSRLPLADKYRQVNVALAGRTAILTGFVATESDALYLERLVGIEAGIDRVDNQITIASVQSLDPSEETVQALRTSN